MLLASSDCAPCHTLLEELVEHAWDNEVGLVVVLDGESDLDGALRHAHLATLWETAETAVAHALHSNVYPTAFALVGNTVAAPATVPSSLHDLIDLAGRVPDLQDTTS